VLGRIATGYLADFVVLSDDVFAMGDAMDIVRTRVVTTVAGGRLVHDG
jgi:predicted amidohydrolase YtcJ